MIDTHTHLNFKDFDQDYLKVIQNSVQNGVKAIINVGSDFGTSEKAIKIAKESEICFAAIGIHPVHTDRVEGINREEIWEKLEKLAKEDKVVAIGETGLDYYHLPKEIQAREKLIREQKELLEIHLKLAKKLNLPLILHCRDAYEDLLNILENKAGLRGVIHCFCGGLEIAKRFLNLDFYIGFTGMITYPGNEKLGEVILSAPLKKILVETDCPYLTPQPKRGERNLPEYVRYVIQKIGEIKGLDYKEVEKKTSENAVKVFNSLAP